MRRTGRGLWESSRVSVAVVCCALGGVLFGAVSGAVASSGGVVWDVQAQGAPTQFMEADGLECKPPAARTFCDGFMVSVQNVGEAESPGGLTLVDHLPPGFATNGRVESINEGWVCSQGAVVTCTLAEPVAAKQYAPALRIYVNSPVGFEPATVENVASVSGGGAVDSVSRGTVVSVNGVAPVFGVKEVEFEPVGESGAPSVGAGVHPWAVTAGFFIPTVHTSPKGTSSSSNSLEGPFEPVRNIRTAVFELPFGLAGDPQSTEQCTEAELDERGGNGGSNCPVGSEIGTIAIAAGANLYGELGVTGEECCSAVFNVKPQAGYPAEFGFKYVGSIPVYMYPSVVRASSGVAGVPAGYRVRVVAAGLPNEAELDGVVLTIFGETAKLDAHGAPEAFITNPAECGGGPENARVELEAWTEPGVTRSGEAVAYPKLTGCELLGFSPSLVFQPSDGLGGGEPGSTVADEPSGYDATVELPQTGGFGEAATSDIRSAVVTLPAGVSVNPGAGAGLGGCDAEGPHGINIGSESFGHFGADLGDPEATELGAGHPGGNNSPYDDAVYHTAPGHCPESSIVGTAEISTPILPEPLKGHVFVATPSCGGAGEPACTSASAANGELYGAYLEVSGDGSIVKLASSLSVNPVTGQITASFRENPELPVSEVKLHLTGGPRAAFANPQTCGTATTTAVFESWSNTSAETSSGFPVTGCPASAPFAPGFLAGSEGSAAGGYFPFALTITRQDREQNISDVSVTTPPGVGALLAGVPRCAEPQAAAGTCPEESLIGHVTVEAGPGEKPLVLTGKAYLTGSYKGAPFGLSIVVPINAGPFHLGNEVVRSSISINPITAAVTTTSDPIPQIKDGVPTRLRALHVSIDRNNFFYNPTNCETQKVTATVTAAQGAVEHPETLFTASNCASLKFKPDFKVSTSAKTSRVNGASLTVHVVYPKSGDPTSASGGQANIKRVHVELPKTLPSRLNTLQKACPAATFESNPANCGSGSVVGHAVVHTQVLPVPLEGPAYFVSHGGAQFPELVVVLQGYGVTVQLHGETFINEKTNVTSSTFKETPDVPFESFELNLPEGPNSALAAIGNLCNQHLVLPTQLTGQNGAELDQQTPIEVEGCPNSLTVVSEKVKGNKVTLKVVVPAGGKLSASGKGLKGSSKSASGRETITITVPKKKAGKLVTKIKLSFKPKKGKQLSKTVTAKFKH